MICPYIAHADGTVELIVDCVENEENLEQCSESNIMEVYNVIPGPDPEEAEYASEDDPDVEYLLYGGTLLIEYTSFLILKQAAPRLKPPVLYVLAHGADNTQGHVEGVDYGPVGGILDQDADWTGVCGLKDAEEWGPFWKKLLKAKDKTPDEILHEVWRGAGNFWVFVRPDRFPITETIAAEPLPTFLWNEKNLHKTTPFESLPLDVLLTICQQTPIRTIYALVGSCKRIRALVLPHADSIAYRRLKEDEPWYLPAGPFELKDKRHGREEIDWWTAQWAFGGISGDDLDTKIPWFRYRKQCSGSMSMWNRKRIWGVVKQLERLAEERGLV